MKDANSSHTELNSIQISLLRLFNRPMTEQETLQLKRLLVNHYSGLLSDELEKVVTKKGYIQKDFDDMLHKES